MKETLEIEREWLVPSDVLIPESLAIQKIKITQMYLLSDKKERLRISEFDNKKIYTHTIKRAAEGGGNWELEREIDEKEFCKLVLGVDKNCYIILKERNVFYIDNTKYELDIFIHPLKIKILEVEIPSFDTHVFIPEWLSGIIEVTNIKGFSNKRIATKPEVTLKKAKELFLNQS